MEATESQRHQEAWSLLPWLANGRADDAQRRRAEAHLASCASCRAELAREQRLTAAMSVPAVQGPALSQGLTRLMQRLDHAETVAPLHPRAPARAGRSLSIRLSTAALLGAAQLALVAAAAAVWLHSLGPTAGRTADYQTLTQAPVATAPAAPGLRVVFKRGQSIDELQALLVTHGLTIVSGPTEAGVFTLRPAVPLPAPELDALAASLRRSPAIAFAEAAGPVVGR